MDLLLICMSNGLCEDSRRVVKLVVGTQCQQQRNDDLSHNHNPKMELKQSGLTAVYKTKHVLV